MSTEADGCHSIDDVIAGLDRIIAGAQRRGNLIGYFAAAYKHPTVSIRGLLGRGFFEDDARMETLDVVFARRFLNAHQRWSTGGRCSAPWRTAFDALSVPGLTIMQYISACMLVHIQYDLGIAVAEVSAGQPLEAIKSDFGKLNGVFAAIGTVLMKELAEVSPNIATLNKIVAPIERPALDLTAMILRRSAWEHAQALHGCHGDAHAQHLQEYGKRTSAEVTAVVHPPSLIKPLMDHVAAQENHDVAQVIAIIDSRAVVHYQGMQVPT